MVVVVDATVGRQSCRLVVSSRFISMKLVNDRQKRSALQRC